MRHAMARRHVLRSAALMPLALAACRYPDDPDGTLDRVTGGTLRVGVLEAAPLAAWQGETPAGVEVDLAAGLAAELDARPAWFRRRDTALRRALEERELDLVLGGLLEDDPWSARLAFTRPWLDEAVVVLGRSGRPLDDIDGHPVAVDDAYLAALVAQEGGLPVAPDEDRAVGRVASLWRLPSEAEPEGLVLVTHRHVMAVPLGENAWLLRLERHLRGIPALTARDALNAA
jgi:polar amino acid transport system substrate-binding protein